MPGQRWLLAGRWRALARALAHAICTVELMPVAMLLYARAHHLHSLICEYLTGFASKFTTQLVIMPALGFRRAHSVVATQSLDTWCINKGWTVLSTSNLPARIVNGVVAQDCMFSSLILWSRERDQRFKLPDEPDAPPSQLPDVPHMRSMSVDGVSAIFDDEQHPLNDHAHALLREWATRNGFQLGFDATEEQLTAAGEAWMAAIMGTGASPLVIAIAG